MLGTSVKWKPPQNFIGENHKGEIIVVDVETLSQPFSTSLFSKKGNLIKCGLCFQN